MPRRRFNRPYSSSPLAKYLFSFFLIFLILIFFVWSRFQANLLAYEITKGLELEQQKIDEGRALSIELNNLQSLSRIEKIAKEDLGFEQSKPDQVVLLDTKTPSKANETIAKK